MPKSDVIHEKNLGENRFRELKVYYQKKSMSYWDYKVKPTGIYFASHQFTRSGAMQSWSTGQQGDGYLCVEELDRYRPSALKAVQQRVADDAHAIHDLLDHPTAQNMKRLQAILRGEPLELEDVA